MDGEDLIEKLNSDEKNNEPKTSVKSRSPLRWPVLVLCSFVMFCSYYCYDNPAALYNQLKDPKNTGLSATQINGLYSAYSLPNMVLPFFGGYLVDRYGVRRTTVAFAFCLVCGQTLFALAASINSGRGSGPYAMMMVARVVYGLGGESLCVAAQTLLADWFMGKEMALAMGINLSVSRLGSVVNDQTSVALYTAMGGIGGALWIGVILVSCGLCAAMLCAMLDKIVSTQDAVERRLTFAESIKKSFVAQNSSVFEKSPERRSVHATSFVADPVENDSKDADFSLAEMGRTILKFRKIFWLLCVGCVVVYATVLPFNNIASAFLSHKYYPDYIGNHLRSDGECVPYEQSRKDSLKDDASHFANIWMMVPFSISAALSPFLGAFVDRFGIRAALMLVSAVVLTGVHLFLGLAASVKFTGRVDSSTATLDIEWYEHPAVGLSFMGIAYSFYAAAVWPAVVYVVDEDQVGTAYGLVTAIQNTGLFLVPVLVGVLTEDTPACDPSRHAGGYAKVEMLLVGFGALGCLIGIYLHTIPQGRMLNARDPWAAGIAGDKDTKVPVEDADLLTSAVASPTSTVQP